MDEVSTGPVLRYLDMQERQTSRDLWEEAFPEDSRAFADYYFSEKIRDNRILVLEESGRIDGMIQLNPYLVQVKEKQWKIDYLVGVATRMDRRHRGYMRRLLMRMMTDMRADGMPFCFLMPADEAIYRPFGFTFIFDQPQFEWKNCQWGKSLKRMEVSENASEIWNENGADTEIPDGAKWSASAAAEWMNQWLSDRFEVYAVRDDVYVKRLLKELASEDGSLTAVLDGDDWIGLESFWGLEKKVLRLRYAEDEYIEQRKQPKPAIMARIIDVERFVSVISLKETVEEAQKILILNLNDPLIPENEGLWKWTLDHSGSKLERQQKAEAADLVLTITELTEWLFGYGTPEAAGAGLEMVQPLRGVFLDEVV